MMKRRRSVLSTQSDESLMSLMVFLKEHFRKTGGEVIRVQDVTVVPALRVTSQSGRFIFTPETLWETLRRQQTLNPVTKIKAFTTMTGATR